MIAPLVVTDAQAHPPMTGLNTWLVASAREQRPVTLDEVYPCRCEDLDPDPPQWKVERAKRADGNVYRCDPWISKKGRNVGQWDNRCPCWGQVRDGRPDGCCAHHEGNPRYIEVGPDGRPLHATIPPDREAGWRAPHERVERDIEDVHPSAAYAEALGMPVDVEPDPYVRRWSHAELHCDCRTPWDHIVDKDGKPTERGAGFHCSADGCHTNWRNAATALMHKRSVLVPCRRPESIVDVETGASVLRARMEGGFTVWG